MLPAGWHRSFQILAACIWVRTWDVRSYTWVWSVAMAGVENWQHGMLHRALNKLYSCSFWQGSKSFRTILKLLLRYTGMGLVDLKGGFKFASEVTNGWSFFCLSEQTEIIDSFKVGPEPSETHGRLWNEEFLGKLRVLGEVENFQTELLDMPPDLLDKKTLRLDPIS